MNNIIRGLSFAFIPIIVRGVLAWMQQPQQTKKGEVHYPKFFLILGTICSALFATPVLIGAIFDASSWVILLGFIPLSLSSSLIIAYVNFRISYDQDRIETKNFFGIKRTFTYEQVTGIQKNKHETYLFIGKHTVMVDKYAIGGDDFIIFVKKKYTALHERCKLPTIRNGKKDIFKGNVTDPRTYILLYSMVSLIVVILLGFVLSLIYSHSSAVYGSPQFVTFASCSISADEMILTSVDHQTYTIQFIDEQFCTEEIRRVCDGEKLVTVHSEKNKRNGGQVYYSVYAIEYNGVYILPFEETDRLFRQEYQPLLILLLPLFGAWFVFVALSIIVGRNPHKFSQRFVRRFFREESMYSVVT